MKNKTLVILTVLAFACSSLFLFASCAKKQIGAAEEQVTEEPVKEEVAKDDDYAEREKARQAELARLAALQREIDAFESEHIYFDFDRSELKPEAQAVLKKKAEWMKANPEYTVRIEGHCDERGTNEYNLALGERRANAAKKFLTALGISDTRLRTISYGEERPADPGHNEDAWAKNRRDEFRLLK